MELVASVDVKTKGVKKLFIYSSERTEQISIKSKVWFDLFKSLFFLILIFSIYSIQF